MTGRPLIGVTGPNKGGFIAWIMTAMAIRRCGGKPVRVTPARPYDERLLDGIVIGGGSDVEPIHYDEFWQQEEVEKTGERNSLLDWLVVFFLSVFRAIFALRLRGGYDQDRDALEKRVAKFAIYNNIPTLGICRGAQLMNIVLGGTLHMDIRHFYNEDTSNIRSLLPRKSITVTPGTLLHAILKTEFCRVNALHDQSINEPGRGITVSAAEPTGVVQAIEKPDHPFFLGVQWHPEYMPQSAPQRHLFHSLVSASRRARREQRA